MARYQVILSYDGTDFHGFQRQGNDRTVQLEVENTLRRMGWQGRSILAAGRTDTGVHASGQVIAFDLDWAHSNETLAKALTAFLPPDIGVHSVRQAPDNFHPRFEACKRSYRYRVYFKPLRDPLQDRFAWRFWPKLDSRLLEEAAGVFIGEHNFAAFGSPMKPGGNTVRTVYVSEWCFQGEHWSYRIVANAFLYRMVRRVVFAQVKYAEGRLPLEQLVQAVQNMAAVPAGLAPSNGLDLFEVDFCKQMPGLA